MRRLILPVTGALCGFLGGWTGLICFTAACVACVTYVELSERDRGA